jgi:RNA polymerase sigma factor (sigma-70 family)
MVPVTFFLHRATMLRDRTTSLWRWWRETMTALGLSDETPDVDVWQQVLEGSTAAFEVLVRRFQSLVSAVAYNACGDLALSEDVAQETFWHAWQERYSLHEPARLRSWLCGIARNLGNNARRRVSRRAEAVNILSAGTDVPTDRPGPPEEAVSREEESLVWQSLEQIPETYREPLILFYREQESIAAVALALGLSEDAVKQRLSRGRGMLRDKMAEVVEGALRRTRPGRPFTVAVMTGVGTLAAGGKTALAGTGTAGVASGGLAAAGAGVAGGVLGSLGGLAGAWLGIWVPSQLAPTKRERDYIRRRGLRMLLVSLLFVAVLLSVAVVFPPAGWQYLIVWGVWFVSYAGYVTIETVCMARSVQRLRNATVSPGHLNDAPLRVAAVAMARRYRGRVWRSKAMFLGRPLVDVNVSDLVVPGGPQRDRRVARGWIAIGDEAHGLLLAVGGKAYGFLAIGGAAVGVLSIGGLAIGLIALGGLALGVLGIGGLGMGVFAFGGGAIGWQACGGFALAWDVAAGGGAVAWHAAYGGAAVAHSYAVGGGAWAEHANDDAARALLLDHPLRHAIEWSGANGGWIGAGMGPLSVLLAGVLVLLMYRREPNPEAGDQPGSRHEPG